MSAKKWISVFIIIISLCTAALFGAEFINKNRTVAVITLEGKELYLIDLTKENTTFVISTKYGTNTVTVQKGEIRITSADCPDKLCVKHGALKSVSSPIVCLPNKLVISLQKNDADSTAVDVVSR